MLRVIASRNAKEYYAESLKREDYYTEGQEIRGEWQGTSASCFANRAWNTASK